MIIIKRLKYPHFCESREVTYTDLITFKYFMAKIIKLNEISHQPNHYKPKIIRNGQTTHTVLERGRERESEKKKNECHTVE